MIKTIGLDIVSVPRIEHAMQNPRFLKRILSDLERKDTNLTPERVAGRWAAKEAIAKAVGTHIGWHDVMIRNDHTGRPEAHIAPHRLPPGSAVMVSISHEKEMAAAVAVLVTKSS